VFVSAVVEAHLIVHFMKLGPSTTLADSLRSGRNNVFSYALAALHSTFHEALNI
jgi:hypothetical protein